MFEFSIIEECTADNIYKREIHWIDFYDSFKNGYNRTLGGEGGNGTSPSKEIRQKLSSERMGKNNPFYGKKHEDGWLEKVIGASNEATRKPILQIDMNSGEIIKRFDSLSEAKTELNCTTTAISRCLNGKSYYSMGYYWAYDNGTYNKEKYKKIESYKRTKVIQIDMKSKEHIRVFDSVKDAGEYIGIKPHNISNCLIGRQKSAGGYIWEYL